MKPWMLVATLLIAVAPSFAGSITYALQVEGPGTVLLTTNSNPLLAASSGSCWNCLLFFSRLESGPHTISYTLDIGLFHFTSSETANCDVSCVYSQVYLLTGFAKPTQARRNIEWWHSSLPIYLRCCARTDHPMVAGDRRDRYCSAPPVPSPRRVMCCLTICLVGGKSRRKLAYSSGKIVKTRLAIQLIAGSSLRLARTEARTSLRVAGFV